MLGKFRWAEDRCNPADPLRQYLRPHLLLRPYIAHYTLYYPFGAPEPTLNVVPDASGCLAFTVTATHVHSVFIGASTQAITVPNRLTPPRLFVEFRPGGAHRLMNLPHYALRDARADLRDLSSVLERAITEAIESTRNTEELTAALDRLFLGCLSARPEHHPAVPALLAMQSSGEELLSVRALAAATGYSERHLSRIVQAHLGVGLKSYLRMVRLNHIIERLRRNPGGLAAIAADAGYYDQAHFTRDFKTVCGVTPAAFVASMSLFYNEPFKF